MKRLTITAEDRHIANLVVAFSDNLKHAIDIRIESVPDEPTKPTHRKTVIKGQTCEKIIMSHYLVGASFSREVAEKWLVAAGYAASSSTPTLSGLVRKGRLSRSDDGNYLFVTTQAKGTSL